MPRREKELQERDAIRDIGEELLQAIRDVKAGHHGARYDAERNQRAEQAEPGTDHDIPKPDA